jgi:conjugative relaxase-like TrwC/TraI family protein
VLSIGKLSAGQERYYLDHAAERVDVVESVAGGADDYYLDPAEGRGRWLGTAASALSLSGDVTPEDLRRVLAGIQPRTREPLRHANSRLTVSGYDFTFSAPKSVSVLFGVGDDHVRDVIRAAHDRAVKEAVAYVERTAAGVRRGHGGLTVAPADGLVAATFRHRTSRAADPQLHTHVVIANLGRGPDGKWSALDGRRLYAQARAASFVYQAVLRGELTLSLGVHWSEVTKGIAEIEGVPRDVVRAFSTRRAEIEAAMEARGTEGPRAAEAAALATRRKKDRSMTAHDLRATWRNRAASLGWGEPEIARLLDRGRRVQLESETWVQIVNHLAGADGLTRQRSSFGRRDVLLALADALPAGLELQSRSLEELVEWFLASPDVVPLVGENGEERTEGGFRRRDGRVVPLAQQEHRYSTVELLAIEQGLLDTVAQAECLQLGISPDENIDRIVASRPTLAAEQITMVRSLCSRGEGIAVVAGRAGTGKTYALDTAREAWQASGIVVLGAAVARRAARELESGAGIPSTSVHALLGRLDAGARLPENSVLVVDEAGMLGTRQMARLSHYVLASRSKLVLVGDHRQLPELEAGGAFRALSRRAAAIHLTENRRQVAGWERLAVEHLREGRVEAAVELYESHDQLQTFMTPDAAREQLVADWWAAGGGKDTVMIAQRRLDVADLNRRAREQMCVDGRLGADEVAVAGARFSVGDRVVVRCNDLQRGVHNGDLGQVVAIDQTRLRIEIEIAGRDQRVVLDSRFLLTQTEHGQPSLAHAYAITGHIAQGMTVERAYVLGGPGISQEWAYAAMTRGREANRLYVGFDPGLERSDFAPRDVHALNRDMREALITALETSEAQPLALDRAWPGRHRRIGVQRSGREAEIG